MTKEQAKAKMIRAEKRWLQAAVNFEQARRVWLTLNEDALEQCGVYRVEPDEMNQFYDELAEKAMALRE